MHPAKKRTGVRMPTRILGSPSMAIEAFSENGLYSSRGMQAVKEYKTVKEKIIKEYAVPPGLYSRMQLKIVAK